MMLERRMSRQCAFTYAVPFEVGKVCCEGPVLTKYEIINNAKALLKD